MDTNLVTAMELGADAVSHNLSPWQLFLEADIIVKAVILLLIVCSFWSWAIIFEKVTRYRRITRQAVAFEAMFWSGGSLQQLFESVQQEATHPMSRLFESAMREWQRFSTGNNPQLDTARLEGLQRRITHAMDVTLDRELDQLQKYLGFLATVGSTAPFVGLFGTVWGIMNSFQSIAASKDTSLAVVAPGIAEALFATALGLVAAIPSVVAYNKLSGDLDRYSGRLESFGTEFRSLMSRQLEERST